MDGELERILRGDAADEHAVDQLRQLYEVYQRL